jgi:hypothetical protein
MRWRRVRLAVVGPVAVVVSLGAVVLWPTPDRITRESFDRVGMGMARADVEAVLGPPGFHATRAVKPVLNCAALWGPSAAGWQLWEGESVGTRPSDGEADLWQGDTIIAFVYFNAAGLVVAKEFRKVERLPQGPVDRLLFRLQQFERQIRYSVDTRPALNAKE